ncbi:Multiple epidermal growth factor-like domains protein 10 isoform X4 [Oopsacas minuta]|uniref:Multiple epidermal growth factor-like domains protein 10 isoform X4 n=1 Tax=Oopsacas minuta TaxID=111878 RepID=A0AAV7K209_9METZ|nr:Multiple epidermal growth factor-like domains protein 10 isoform X4 [Oopsacas minuta]
MVSPDNSIVYSIFLTESPADLPSVIIHSHIPGTLYTHRDTLILVTVDIPVCLSITHSPLSFSWTLSNPVTSPLTSSLPVLFIPANMLNMSNQITYTLSDGNKSLTSLFSIDLTLGDPVALILGGDIRTHYLEEDLIIDGSGSFDPSQHSLTYSWTCVDTEGLTPCEDNNNNLLITQDSNKQYMFEQVKLRESVIQFSLVVVTSDSRISATSYLTVHISSSTPDLIYFNPISYLRVPVNQLTLVTGWVRSSSPLNTLLISTEKDVVDDQYYYDYSPDLEVEYISFISLPSLYQLPYDSIYLPTMRLTQFSFLIPLIYLATRQKFRLMASLSCDSISTAIAKMDILIDSAPHLGGITHSSYMNNGVEVYSMIASGWIDTPSALPLKYRYGIRQESEVHWLTPSTTLSQLDTPLLCSISGELPLILEVENSIGSVVLYPYEIFISTHDDVIGALDKVKQKLVYGYNVMSGLSIVSSIIYFYKIEEQLIPTDIADTLWVYIMSAYWSILPQERSFTRHVIFLITEFILQVNIPSATQTEEIFDVLEHSLTSVISCSVDISDRGITTQLFNNTFAAIAKLDTPDSPVWHRLPHLLSVLAASTRNKNSDILTLSTGLMSIKVSHTYPLASYYAVCNAREQDCTGSLPLIQFSQALFDSYNSWGCYDPDCIIESNRFESVECSGVVITTSQLDKQSYLLPNEYSTQVLSNILSVSLLHPATYQQLDVTNVSITLQIGIVPSTYLCALWSSSTLEWDTSMCDTFPIDNSTVSCQCKTSGTVAVVTTCPAGSYGSLCFDICPHGLWGDKCTETCVCSENSNCLPIDGFCDCFPGYIDSGCYTQCNEWMYGKYCTETCDCYGVNSISCNHISGECDCKIGFRGDDCATTCYPGTWGYMCAEECTCQSTGGCDFIDGTCICEAGYTGIDCGTPCSLWKFGYDCAYNCTCDIDHTTICRSTDGVCICNSSYIGANCGTLLVVTEDPIDPMIIIVGIVIIVVVVIIVVIILICVVVLIVICCKKRNRRVVAISPDKVPLYYYKPDWSRHSQERLSPISNKQVDYQEFVSTKVESEVLVSGGRKDSDSMLEEEDYWYFIEVVIVDDRDCWRPNSQKGTSQASETPFQVPERPEIGMLSLSGRYSNEGKYDNMFDKFPEPVLLPREGNTLTDLREAFVDSGLWLGGPFQFLKKNIAYMFISLANEDDCELSALEDNKIYIQRVKDEDAVMMELCVCGRVSQFDCQCGIRGYCGEDCQTKDWDEHLPLCLKAQNVEDDANMSLNVTMANSLDNYLIEESSQPADIKLAQSSHLEQIGESDQEGEAIPLPPSPIHVLPKVHEKPSFPDMEEVPVTKSEVDLLDTNPKTDEVVVIDVHEDKRRRFVTD